MKKNLIVRQEGNKDCGAASLLSIIRFFGGDISLARLIEMTKTDKDGTNFYNISTAAAELGLVTKSFKADDIEKLKDLGMPILVQLNNKNYNHFVVIYKTFDHKIVVMDPAKGKVVIDNFDFANSWTGYLMIFEKVKNIPHYTDNKILNKIITESLTNNISIIFFLIILSLIYTILTCLTSLYSQLVFDKVVDTTTNNLIVVTVFFFILFIIKNITSFLRSHLVIFLNQKLDVSIILSTYSKVILLPYHFYKNKTSSEVLSRINDLSSIKNFISKIIITIFLDPFAFFLSFIIIYHTSKKALLLLLVVAFLYLLVMIIFNKTIKSNTIQNQENNAQINNIIIESVSTFETVKGLSIEDSMIYKFSKQYSKALNCLYHSEKVNNVIFFLKESIADIGLLLTSFLTIKLIMEGNLTVGSYMTITFLSSYFIYPLKNLVDILSEYHYLKNTIVRANHLLEVEEEDLDNECKLFVSGNIKIKHLTYTFNNKYNVLKDINFFIKDREKVLFMGKSGSGKSTILKILYKYYNSPRNSIYIDNYDLNDYSLANIRKNITYVSQNELLYSGTIRYNIILDRNVSEVEYLNICKITRVDEIVQNNILGYDYLLEENGVNLSGGQRQRIILARSLLKESKIIMIDEGLNQIDIKLEREILTDLFRYFYNKTFIVVSHRNENYDLYDRVIKINNGIVEQIEEKCQT